MSDDKDCKHISGCAMYQLFTLSGTLAVWQNRYCKADYGNCVRYQREACGEPVPNNLMPNGRMLNKG